MAKKSDRHVLFESEQTEVAHIKWPPGSVSRPHDHGVSYGRIKVLKGVVFCLTFDKETKKFLGRSLFKAGETLIETPNIIHIMGNDSKTESAETVHVYTPKLVMKYYPLKLFKWPGMPRSVKRKKVKKRKPQEPPLRIGF